MTTPFTSCEHGLHRLCIKCVQESCSQFTLGAFPGGWMAICLDCAWSEAVTDSENNYEAARVKGEQHTLTGGSAPNPTEATRSNAPFELPAKGDSSLGDRP